MTLKDLHDLSKKVMLERPELANNSVTDVLGNHILGIKLFRTDIPLREITLIASYAEKYSSEDLWIP